MKRPKPTSSSLPSQSVEERRHERRPLHSAIRITYCADATRSAQIAQGIDVSDGGVAFESDLELDFYRVMQLEYTEDDGTNRCRTARLHYRMQRKYGAYFLETE